MFYLCYRFLATQRRWQPSNCLVGSIGKVLGFHPDGVVTGKGVVHVVRSDDLSEGNSGSVQQLLVGSRGEFVRALDGIHALIGALCVQGAEQQSHRSTPAREATAATRGQRGAAPLNARAAEVARLLAIPDGITQTVMLPAAYTKNATLKPAARAPADAVTFWESWGNTRPQDPTQS